MFIHLGENTVIPENEIVGIFDMESTTVTQMTRDFLSKKESNGDVVYVSDKMPKSFVLSENKVYICAVAASTIKKRICK